MNEQEVKSRKAQRPDKQRLISFKADKGALTFGLALLAVAGTLKFGSEKAIEHYEPFQADTGNTPTKTAKAPENPAFDGHVLRVQRELQEATPIGSDPSKITPEITAQYAYESNRDLSKAANVMALVALGVISMAAVTGPGPGERNDRRSRVA